jgi:hypothetical protein
MKIFITESQFKRIIEAVDLNGSFTKLKVGDILVLSISSDKGDFDYKFKVVKDMGDSWMLSNFNVGSVNTGFDFYVKKNENINDAKVVMVKVSKKDKSRKELNATIKNIKSAKIGDDVLDLAKIEKSYDAALIKIEKAEPNIDNESAHNKAVAVIKNQFGDIPEVEIIDNAGYGRVNRGGKSGNLNPEDTEFTDVPKDFTIDTIKSKFVEGSGVKLTLKNGDELDFNVISGSGDAFMIELIKTKSEEYNEYEEVQFNVKLNPDNIELSPDGEYFNMNISIATTTATTRPVVIKYIVNIDKTKKFDDDVELSKKNLLRIIMGDPVLKNAFANTPTLMGLINIGDVRGISKAYDILNRTGFNVDDSDGDGGKNQNFADKFSSGYKVEIYLENRVKFTQGNAIDGGKKVVGVTKSGRKVTLTDEDNNTYGLVEELPNDKYVVNVKRSKQPNREKTTIKVLDYKYKRG